MVEAAPRNTHTHTHNQQTNKLLDPNAVPAQLLWDNLNKWKDASKHTYKHTYKQ